LAELHSQIPSLSDPEPTAQLGPKLGLFHATMIVMGGVVGSGIFMNPYVVAQHLHSPALILGAWVTGGVAALLGAFIYAELAARLPKAGGQYAYLREAMHPAVGFFYGWLALIVINAGGCAAAAVTFARYARELLPFPLPERAIAGTAIVVLAAVNCAGIRAGSAVQSGLMLLRVGAIAILVICGMVWLMRMPAAAAALSSPMFDRKPSLDLVSAFGSAMIPVFFAYGGFQTANFVAAEVREPRKNLPRALLIGMISVIVLYLAVNLICLQVLGTAELAATPAPASAVMQRVAGDIGGKVLAAGVALSTLGFLSQSVLTYPRVLYAMAADNLFPSQVARVHPRTQAPVIAIVLNSALTLAVLLVGRYEEILNYVESVDLVFFGLTALTLFVFRRRDPHASDQTFRVPGHPWTTLAFIAICFSIALHILLRHHGNTLIIALILAVGAIVYRFHGRQA